MLNKTCQAEKSKDFFARINRLRLAKQWTWEETAKAIGLSRSMIHFIKTGKYGITDKVLYRLKEAEIAAALEKMPEERAQFEKFFESMRRADKFKVMDADLKRGYMDLPLEYRVGKVPDGLPKKLRVKAIGSVEAAKYLPQIVLKRDAVDVFLQSIPAEYRGDSFLDKLTPSSVSSMLCVAVLLSYGTLPGYEILTVLGYKFSEQNLKAAKP